MPQTPDYFSRIRRLPYRFQHRECIRIVAEIGGKMKPAKFSHGGLMKTFLAILVAFLLGASALAQQSLGDVARRNRAKKKPGSVMEFNDETMHRTISPDQDESSSGDQDGKPEQAADAKDKASKKDDAEAGQQKAEEMQKSINSQKKKIADMEHELDIMQREQKLRTAAYYGDAGTMLRDSAKYEQDTKKQQDEMDAKKKEIDAAQQKLDDLQEQARKAGVRAE